MCCIYPILMLTVVDVSLQNTSVALRALQRQVSLFLKATLIVLNGSYMVSSCIFQKGQFHIPDDSQLVSCIYWLCCSQKFAKPVNLEIEHCALIHDSSQYSSLRFIAAKCSQAELSYQFRVLKKECSHQWVHMAALKYLSSSFLQSVFLRRSGECGHIHTTAHCTTFKLMLILGMWILLSHCICKQPWQ